MDRIQGKLSQEEFNKRCYEVFEPYDGDVFYFIETEGNDRVFIQMSEKDEDGENNLFVYEPNMQERPHALAYLMGERDNFDD